MGDHALRAHVAHLVRSQNCRVIGAFDPGLKPSANREWLRGRGLESSFRDYGSYDALVSDPNVDAVVIASPDRFHLPQLEKAIHARKHVLCEKPLCADQKELPTLQSLLREAGEKRLGISSCHPRRFDPPYVWLKESLPELIETHGKVLQLGLDFSYHEPGAHKSGLHGGSLLSDHANHEIDYANWLLGARGATMTRLADDLDQYALCGVRDDGVTLHFHGSRRLSKRVYPEKIYVRFERGELELNTYDARLSRIIDHERITHQTGAARTPNESLHPVDHPVTDYEKRFHGVNEDWLNSIIHGSSPYLTSEDLLFNAAVSVGFGKESSGTLRLGRKP
jgi:predicted dehydrogenase